MKHAHQRLLLPSQSTAMPHGQSTRVKQVAIFAVIIGLLLTVTGCQPSPELHVLNYTIGRELGAYDPPDSTAGFGAIAGQVRDADGQPLAGATAIVAERRGTPHIDISDADGRYLITDIPPGRYRVAAVAPGFEEHAAIDETGRPAFVQINADAVTDAPPLMLTPRTILPLPNDLAEDVKLTQTAAYTANSSFPPDSVADVLSYQFARDGEVIDTVRVYLPADRNEDEPLPLLFFGYPGHVDGWEEVSAAFAAQGYGLVALSPVEAWGVDIDQHAYDARIALALARDGALGTDFAADPAVALGGSFTSAILHRLLLVEPDQFSGWVTVGGIANAFTGAEAFYADELELPPRYEFAIPALGQPNLFPLDYLRYSPVYTAGQLPPTSIIHTAADRISPIDQAYELETALKREGVRVETFYYDDVSHYLQIGDDMTTVGEAMFNRILDFIVYTGDGVE